MTDIEELIEKAKKYELEGLGVLDAFTTEEIGGIYNGIGPDRLPEKLRKICTKWGFLLEPAAMIHDIQFELGGGKSEFEKANSFFLKNCVCIIRQTYSAWDPRRCLWYLRSRRWAKWCVMFGWSSFHFQAYHTEAT